jgi:uncharacterized protein (DUF1697 family)
MIKYIALLRGINVSGQKQIKMSDLKLLFEELEFQDVETYIQSGNVIFSFRTATPKSLEEKIERKITEQFGFQVRVIVKTPDELEFVHNNNPFIKKQKKDVAQIYFTFLSETPSIGKIKELKEVNCSPEEYIIDGKTIYLFLPNGYGKAKMNNNFFEKRLNVFATTRNWKTVNALFEMAKSE